MLLLGQGRRDAQTFVPKELSESSLLRRRALPVPPPETLSTSMADSMKLFPKKLLKKGNLFDRNGLRWWWWWWCACVRVCGGGRGGRGGGVVWGGCVGVCVGGWVVGLWVVVVVVVVQTWCNARVSVHSSARAQD